MPAVVYDWIERNKIDICGLYALSQYRLMRGQPFASMVTMNELMRRLLDVDMIDDIDQEILEEFKELHRLIEHWNHPVLAYVMVTVDGEELATVKQREASIGAGAGKKNANPAS